MRVSIREHVHVNAGALSPQELELQASGCFIDNFPSSRWGRCPATVHVQVSEGKAVEPALRFQLYLGYGTRVVGTALKVSISAEPSLGTLPFGY